MGIFSPDRAEDTRTIYSIAASSVRAYQQWVAQTARPPEVEVSFRDDFEHISKIGERIVNNFFETPTALHRVAILLVLSNAFPIFQLRKNGQVFLDVEARKYFLSSFTCLYVHQGLSVFPWRNEADGQNYCMCWKGFPNEDFGRQFLTYMSWTPGAKVQMTQVQSGAQQQETTKLLAQLALGCALMLESCVEPRPIDPPEPPHQLDQ